MKTTETVKSGHFWGNLFCQLSSNVDEMMRKRTFYAPPTAKFQLWRDLVSQPEDEDDSEEIAQLEDDYDYMGKSKSSLMDLVMSFIKF